MAPVPARAPGRPVRDPARSRLEGRGGTKSAATGRAPYRRT